MRTDTVELDTSTDVIRDVTARVNDFVADETDGLVHLFLPHATAGLALFELGAGTEPDVLDAIERLVPRGASYRHHHGSPGHGAAHVLPAFVSPSLSLPVQDGQLLLGTWQSVVVLDTNRDNPRRTLRLSFLAG